MDFTSGESAALRVASTYFDANLFASFLCFALPLGMAGTQSVEKLLPRVLAAAGVLAMLIALAFTQSRSGFFGAAAGCAAFLVAQSRSAGRFARAVLGFALLAGGLWLGLSIYAVEWFSPQIVLDRALAIEPGVAGRTEAWSQILRAFYDHPLAGVGPAQAANWDVYIPNMRANWDIANSRIVAHNIFVDVAVGTGLLGLVPFVFFVALLVWRAWRNVRAATAASVWNAGLFASVVAVAVNSLSMTTLMYPFLWTLAGLVVAGASLETISAVQTATVARAPVPRLAGVQP
jgi:O-antigen ligase